MKEKASKEVKRIIVMIAASLILAVDTQTFVRTGGLIPGGAMGLTVLIQGIFDKYLGMYVPYTPVNIILNAIPVYIGFRFIGKKFTIHSLGVILLTGIFTDLIPTVVITYDPLLIAIFGGLINGLAIAMCLNVDCTTGGTDFISIFMSQKKGSDTFNIILLINTVILITAGLIFGWDKALYSILFQYASTEVIHVLYKRYQKQTMLIVTDKPQEISRKIYDVAHHGTTIIKAQGGYTGEDRYLIYSVVSSDEVKKVMEIVDEAGGTAFVNAIRTEDFLGNFYHRPNT
ncbi:MAG: YitT family protein [Lachnospiraceae bacterium]|nr:YitT family protein [Lachnospiraceae bacterium]MCR4678958.1 YitT family protein [Lachnospiraceae bacterium]